MNETQKANLWHVTQGIGLFIILAIVVVTILGLTGVLGGPSEAEVVETERVEYEADLAQYCRGVIDEYIVYSRAPQPVPAETYVELETFCIEGIKTGDHAEGFRGPITD
jgi:hypothetical protein